MRYRKAYMVSMRDSEFDEAMRVAHEIKEKACELIKMFEQADDDMESDEYDERDYRDYRDYRSGRGYGYRDEMDYGSYRRRDSRGRYI